MSDIITERLSSYNSYRLILILKMLSVLLPENVRHRVGVVSLLLHENTEVPPGPFQDKVDVEESNLGQEKYARLKY